MESNEEIKDRTAEILNFSLNKGPNDPNNENTVEYNKLFHAESTLTEIKELFLIEQELYKIRIQKSASLIAVNGVVLGLESALIPAMMGMTTGYELFFTDIVLKIFLTLVLLINVISICISLYYGVKCHGIDKLRLPDINIILDDYKSKKPSNIKILNQIITDYKHSVISLSTLRNEEVLFLKKGYTSFLIGIISLAVLLSSVFILSII